MSDSNIPTPVSISQKKNALGIEWNRSAIPGVREVYVVASGKGGVGKSTVSANLARSLVRQGKSVGLLDADLYGPSAPSLFGLEGPAAIEGGSYVLPHEKEGIKIISFGSLSDPGSPLIWRGPILSKAVEQLVFQSRWGELDYLIVDLPPGTGDIQMTLIERLPIHGALIVTTPHELALVDARKAINMFRQLEVPIVGIVENMAHFTCGNCEHPHRLFGEGTMDFAQKEDLPILASLPILDENAEVGVWDPIGDALVRREFEI